MNHCSAALADGCVTSFIRFQLFLLCVVYIQASWAAVACECEGMNDCERYMCESICFSRHLRCWALMLKPN